MRIIDRGLKFERRPQEKLGQRRGYKSFCSKLRTRNVEETAPNWLFENSSAGIALVTPDGRYIAANLALSSLGPSVLDCDDQESFN